MDRSIPHQPPVVNDTQQKTSQHQTHRHFRVNPGSPETIGIKFNHLIRQPRQIQNRVHPRQHMIILDQIAQRPADEKLQPIPLFPTQHPTPPPFRAATSEPDVQDLSNSPQGIVF